LSFNIYKDVLHNKYYDLFIYFRPIK